MSVSSSLTVEIPNIDLVSFLLDGIPDLDDSCNDPRFIDPFLLSVENPQEIGISLIDFKHHVKCFAAGLQQAGLKHGDNVMLVSHNYVYSIIICLGVIAAGGVLCTSQPDFKVRDYVDQFVRDEPKFLFVCDEDPLKENAISAWRSCDGDNQRCWLFNERLSNLNEVNNENISAFKYWTELLDRKNGTSFQWRHYTTEAECDTPCQMFYTSGTSGPRKAALFTHKNLVASFTATGCRIRHDTIAVLKATSRGTRTTQAPRRLLHTISIARGQGTSLPLSIVKTRQQRLIEVYFMSRTSGDMAPYLQSIQALRIQDISVAPFTLAKLLPAALDKSLSSTGELDFQYLRSITVTGAPVSQNALDRSREFLISNGAPSTLRVERSLGITEAGGIVSSWRMADPPCHHDGYQGRLEPNVRVKIVNFQDEEDDTTALEAAPGDRGEIWLKSPCCISRYYKNESASEEAFTTDGWYRTGDIGCVKGDALYQFDRKKVRHPGVMSIWKKATKPTAGYPEDAG